MIARRRYVGGLLSITLAVLGLFVGQGSASATAGDIGYQDQSFAGLTHSPTADKPESKTWYTPDGVWWANMFDPASKEWHIFRLDRAAEQWVDTGVATDTRDTSSADVLWDGQKLYVASHVVTESSETVSKPSIAKPALLYRYSYSQADKTYTLDAGFPAAINNNSSESLTLAKDSTGALWATWTQVTVDSSGKYTNTLYVNSTTGSDAAWGQPFTPPVSGVNPSPDDISTIVHFGKNKIGVLWSNQLDGTVYWAVHTDGTALDQWRGGTALHGQNQADDHLSIKAIDSDPAGRVFAVVKTGLDMNTPPNPSDPQILLLSFKPGTGAWSSTVFGTLANCHTRPQLVLDEMNQTVHVIATAPTDPGCPHSGTPGTIYEKTTPMDNPVFLPGRGTPIIRDAASAQMNDATTTKQSVSGSTGLIVLASNLATQRYWHADLQLPGGTLPSAPAAAFSASPTSGTAPLTVQFTDASTGGATRWAWNFGDGATSTSQNPSHTYSSAGTYTVTLIARNATGDSAPVSHTVSVAPAPVPDRLTVGQSLTPGQSLTSDGGRYRLVLQGDGNLVVYDGGRAIWNTRTAGQPAARLVVQGDGNVVLYSSAGKALWNTVTPGNTGVQLVMQSDGNLVLYASGGRALWSSRTGRIGGTAPAPRNDTLAAGSALVRGQQLTSAGGRYRLVMQGDGNLVVYDGGRAIWNTRTGGRGGARLVVQGDGNVVLYASWGKPLWFTATAGHAGVRLVMQSDGNLVLYAPGRALWSSKTGRIG